MDLQLINIDKILEEIQKRYSTFIVFGKNCVNEKENKHETLGQCGKDILKSFALTHLLKTQYEKFIFDDFSKSCQRDK